MAERWHLHRSAGRAGPAGRPERWHGDVHHPPAPYSPSVAELATVRGHPRWRVLLRAGATRLTLARRSEGLSRPEFPTEAVMQNRTSLPQKFLDDFDPAYVEHVVLPFFDATTYKGERLSLPMIDTALTKENAVSRHLWGLLSDDWSPC